MHMAQRHVAYSAQPAGAQGGQPIGARVAWPTAYGAQRGPHNCISCSPPDCFMRSTMFRMPFRASHAWHAMTGMIYVQSTHEHT